MFDVQTQIRQLGQCRTVPNLVACMEAFSDDVKRDPRVEKAFKERLAALKEVRV